MAANAPLVMDIVSAVTRIRMSTPGGPEQCCRVEYCSPELPMEVQPGVLLGSYEVVDLLGEGGMGSVWRATDKRLGREVALKVIRSPLADDPERILRFTREAQLLASLSHPHIAAIHGLEQAGNLRFLVLELVPGESLADRIGRGPLPVREALTLAAQVASAIETAHERGVIHRDLKPANIKITPEGRAKVLDFGLAKAFSPGAGSGAVGTAPTVSWSGTTDGTILGTAPYMSPEQARGKEVDKRTDIWAFGCVLFEMLAGEAAFARDTVSDTIVAILTLDPDWTRLPASVPEPVRRLLHRLLERDVKQRLHDIGDARIEIEDALAAGTDPATPAARHGEPVPLPQRSWKLTAGAALAAAALGAAAVLVWRSPGPRPAGQSVQFALPLPASERFAGLSFPAVAFSPPGTHIVFVASRGGRQRLFARALAGFESLPIEGTEGALSPFFSPDGEWVGFFADGKLKKIRLAGGPARTLCDAAIGFGGAWLPDGTIVFAPDNGSALWRVSAEGGAPQPFSTLDAARGEFSHRWPELVPGGRSVLFTVGIEGSWDDAEIVVQSLAKSERHTVVHGGTNPKVAANGELLYARGGAAFAVPFDSAAGRTTGAPRRALASVSESSDGAMQLGLSAAGSVVYLAGQIDENARKLVWVDRRGSALPLAAPDRPYASPRLSPDGRTLAVTVSGADRDEVWTYDIARNVLTQFTFEGGTSPVWTSSGHRLVFSASRSGPANLFWKGTDDSSTGDERLTRSPAVEAPGSSSADGRTVAYVRRERTTGDDILLLDTDDRSSRPFVDSPANESAPALSPDGRWIAWVSDESGRDEVYAAATGDPARKIRVSPAGGGEPVWRPDGAELFFRSGNRMMVAAVKRGGSLALEPAAELFKGDFEAGVAARPAYDVSADGARFLMIAGDTAEAAPAELRVVLGWNAGTAP